MSFIVDVFEHLQLLWICTLALTITTTDVSSDLGEFWSKILGYVSVETIPLCYG